MDLAVMVYRITKTFPNSVMYGLVAQLRRSAASVPASVAEGRGRYTTKDFANFVSIVKGSLMETETLYCSVAATLQENSTSRLAL
jgi:four helix bundle protein